MTNDPAYWDFVEIAAEEAVDVVASSEDAVDLGAAASEKAYEHGVRRDDVLSFISDEYSLDAGPEPVAVDGPPPGTYAFTARMMAEVFPDFDWDAWKDEMKEASP